MKIAALIAMAALCLSFQTLQTKGTFQQNQPVITGVQTTMAYEPGLVSIFGRQLGLVSQVKIDGLAVPIVRQFDKEIVIQRELMNPGFAALDLVRPGTAAVKGAIEFAPSLAAGRTLDGLRIVVNPGEGGLIWINWSLRALDQPYSLPGVYYPQLLDLTIPSSGQLCSEVSRSGEPVVVNMRLPIAPYDLLELRKTAYLQAFCLLGNEAYLCHTNMVSVPSGLIRVGGLTE